MKEGWVYEGRCWKLGHNVPNDGGLMDKKFMGQLLEYDPEKLAPHTLARLRPEFGREARPGDVVVAGRRFAYGNPHIQGSLGLHRLGVAVVVEGLQRSSFRLLITAGVPFLPRAEGVLDLAEDGDRLRVDISTGEFQNLTSGTESKFEPLPGYLLEVIEAGGVQGHLRKRLTARGAVLRAAGPERPAPRGDGGRTAAEKILARAAGRETVRAGEVIYPEPDLIVMQDLHAHLFLRDLWNMGVRSLWRPERVMVAIDHRVPAPDAKTAEIHREIRGWCEKYRVGHFFGVGNGITHPLQIERGLARPGTFVVTKDVHSPNAGAVGALAIPLVYDTPTFLALGSSWVRVPETIRVNLGGKPPPGVLPRDVAHWSTTRIGYEQADYRVIEFGGDYVDALGIDGRQTLCNVVIEVGAKSAIVNPDEKACGHMRARTGVPFEPLRSDPDAGYALTLDLDVSELEPLVAAPPSPDNLVPVSEVAGKPVHQIFVGSCASGGIEDLRAAAAALKGRRIAAGVRALITPGTREVYLQALKEGLIEVFLAAGALVTPPGCGACAGAVAPLSDGERTVCTATRNEPGRMGSYDAEIYIANPATTAASGVAGAIADPRGYLA